LVALEEEGRERKGMKRRTKRRKKKEEHQLEEDTYSTSNEIIFTSILYS
jgi:hypothetical protein